jgi:hypothetical protein
MVIITIKFKNYLIFISETRRPSERRTLSIHSLKQNKIKKLNKNLKELFLLLFGDVSKSRKKNMTFLCQDVCILTG